MSRNEKNELSILTCDESCVYTAVCLPQTAVRKHLFVHDMDASKPTIKAVCNCRRCQSRYYSFNTPSTTFIISTSSSSIILFPITCTCVGNPSHSSASSAISQPQAYPRFAKITYKAVRNSPPPSQTPYHPPSPPSQQPAPHSANSAD